VNDIEIIVVDEMLDMFPADQETIGAYAERVMTSLGIRESDINIVFIGDVKMRELNEMYKQRIGTTDVLSFNLSEDDAEILEGEVYVSLDQALRQASEFGVSDVEELVRLVTHGLLHLAGRTHGTDEDMQSMTAETEALMRTYIENGDIL
jgi:probable rRNA maturation factor